MSTAPILRRLYSLDASSPDFLHYLYPLFRHDKDERYLQNLQGSELARLVDFLDQIVGVISADRDMSRKCLDKLRAICGHRATLPSSCVVSRKITRVGSGPIAVGPIADVWEGNYCTKKVSIKCLKIPPDGDQTLKKSFFEAAVMWKRLKHPNIVSFIGVIMDPLQIVSEWMSNGTLIEFVNENPGANRISLVLDVAEGLDHLHANHAIHGNLNGSRILVGRDCHARLTDVKFSSIVRGVSSVTHENEYITAWAAPEILEGGGTITREADVFAFGMIVIEVFTGRCPFSELTAPVVTSEIINGRRPARPQEAQGLGLTDPVWDMTIRCWDQDPAQRPKMAEVVRLLRECYRSISWRARITDIPVRIFINRILPFCEAKDVFSLCCTNRFFALVTGNYHFIGSEMTRTSGWKSIYLKLRNARIFIWGEVSRMLGLSEFRETLFPGVSLPVELHLPSVRVVSLAMSGWSLHMLGADGSVYVIGSLSTDRFPSSNKGLDPGPYECVQTPLKLQLPAPTRGISCNFDRVMTLDANSMVWTFARWDRPLRLVSPSLDCSSPKTTPVQVECGLFTCAVLTKSGDMYAWWPFTSTLKDRYKEGLAELERKESTRPIIPDDRAVIPCRTLEIDWDPVKIPMPADLPELPGTGLSEEGRRKDTKLIKIAATYQRFIGLTNKGHVLRSDMVDGESSTMTWHYLPNFSEIDKIKECSAFHTTIGNNGEERPPEVELLSDMMLVTHVSACGEFFFTYSSSMILMGRYNITPETLPTVIPRLQNRSDISVVSGYKHFGALTSGKLLTWGEYSLGALGLGDPGKLPIGSPGGYATEEWGIKDGMRYPPPDVTVPTEVKFDHGLEAEGRVKRYCLAAAAGGYSTAALVVDLVEDEDSPEGLK